MTPSYGQHLQNSREKTNSGCERDLRRATNVAGLNVADYRPRPPAQRATRETAAYDPIEDLERTMQAYHYDGNSPPSTSSRSSFSASSSSAYLTSAGSSEVNHGSAHRPTSSRTTISGEKISSGGSHDRAGGRSDSDHDDHSIVPYGQRLSCANYGSLGGGVTHPSPLEMWQSSRHRHEELAYLLERKRNPKTTRR